MAAGAGAQPSRQPDVLAIGIAALVTGHDPTLLRFDFGSAAPPAVPVKDVASADPIVPDVPVLEAPVVQGETRHGLLPLAVGFGASHLVTLRHGGTPRVPVG